MDEHNQGITAKLKELEEKEAKLRKLEDQKAWTEARASVAQSPRPKGLAHNFTYHPPLPEQISKYGEIRSRALDLAEFLSQTVPQSRELSLALTKIEEAVMWANAGIARNS